MEIVSALHSLEQLLLRMWWQCVQWNWRRNGREVIFAKWVLPTDGAITSGVWRGSPIQGNRGTASKYVIYERIKKIFVLRIFILIHDERKNISLLWKQILRKKMLKKRWNEVKMHWIHQFTHCSERTLAISTSLCRSCSKRFSAGVWKCNFDYYTLFLPKNIGCHKNANILLKWLWCGEGELKAMKT